MPLPVFARSALRVALAVALLAFAGAAPAAAGFNEGVIAARNGDWETAMREWLPLAEEGNPGAQANVGDLFAHGLGVEKDLVEAFRWHRLAAEQGIGKSQLFVGLALAAGNGVERDSVRGGMWILVAQRTGARGARQAFQYARVQMTDEQMAEAQRLADAWQPQPAE